MRVLALDTATKTQSVAITLPDGALIEKRCKVARGHSRDLLFTIQSILEEACVSAQDVELVAVGLGPGSFTGLRVGLAAAKAFCLAHECPIVGVSSLEALALGALEAHTARICVAALDARKREVYGAVFARDSTERVEPLVEAAAIAPALLCSALANYAGPIVAVGNGFDVYAGSFEDATLVRLELTFDTPSAKLVARLGQRVFADEGGAGLAGLEPHYCRLSDAELNWQRRS